MYQNFKTYQQEVVESARGRNGESWAVKVPTENREKARGSDGGGFRSQASEAEKGLAAKSMEGAWGIKIEKAAEDG